MSSTPFNVLFQQAAALKTAQLAVDRTKFDGWDSWYQHSLFAKEDVKEMRAVDKFDRRFNFAKDCKQRGNDHYKDLDYDGAINEYERCLSLFEWVEPTDPDWKNKGIQDKLLLEKTYPAHNKCSREEVQQIDELKLTCILNLSMCYWKTNDWSNCIRACNRALQMDPQNTKALYRRAQARIIPAYCGMTENLQALEDLKKAVSLKPDDSLLTTAYAELKISLSEQKKKDKKTFSNLFDRKEGSTDSMDALGSDVDQQRNLNGASSGGSSSSSKAADNKNLTWQDAFNMVKDMESAAARCDRDGLTAQAAAIRAKKDELQAQMMVYFPAHLQKPFPELMAAAQLRGSGSSNVSVSTSSSSGAGAGAGFRSVSTDSIASDVPVTTAGGSKKKGKSKTNTAATATGSSSSPSATSAGDNTTVSSAVTTKTTSSGGGGGGAKPSSSARSKVTTAAGGELSGAWFDAYGNDYDLVDFSKPTEEMIRDAQSRGLDLTDVRVQQLMQEINKVRIKNTRLDERLGRGASGKAGKAGSKSASSESPTATAQRMEAYMQEALQNIHTEEASRITATLLTDIAVSTQRKMLATRLQYLAKEKEQELLHNSEIDTPRDVSESDAPLSDDGRPTAHSSAYTPAHTVSNMCTVRPGFTAHNVFNTQIDPKQCDPAELKQVLRDMMVVDIVQLRQTLEREEYERSMKARNTPPSDNVADGNTSSTSTSAIGAGSAVAKGKKKKGGANKAVAAGNNTAGTSNTTATVHTGCTLGSSKKYTAEEEEAARLSLSEEIVDMLEARYGTAMHSGEASPTSGLLRNAMVVAAIACAVLFCVNVILRLVLSLGMHHPGPNVNTMVPDPHLHNPKEDPFAESGYL